MKLSTSASVKATAVLWAFTLLGLTGLLAALRSASADEVLPPLLLELLASPDRDTRGLALEQIRDEFPGPEVTRSLTNALATLSPDAQSALLEALGDRGDSIARPAVLGAAGASVEEVRLSALRALERVGDGRDVGVLGERAANGSPREREAARRSLAHLRDSAAIESIVAQLPAASPAVRVEFLRTLALRKATNAVPAMLPRIEDPESSVRLAALAAVQELGDARCAALVITALESSSNEAERNAAEGALLAISAREGVRCLPAVVEALPRATAETRVTLLSALAAIGGSQALARVIQACEDSAPSVRDEAVRLLSNWADAAVVPTLLKIARETRNPVHHVLALRGLVRIASAPNPVHPDMALVRQSWVLARSTEEKRLVLGAVGGGATKECFTLAAQALEDPEVSDEAGLAVVMVAGRLAELDAECRDVLRKINDHARDPAMRKRAAECLKRAGKGSEPAALR